MAKVGAGQRLWLRAAKDDSMTDRRERERPSQFDGTQYVIFVDLPPQAWITSQLYEHVYGARLDDGAKPWPYFRDPTTGQWWSLSTPGGFPVDALAWMIDLDQLAYKQPEDARMFLEGVLTELEVRAKQFGGVAVPEIPIPEALARMVKVRELLRVRDYVVMIVIAAPDGQAFRVADWWQALEGAGLEWGDGDLFWLYNETFTEDDSQPYELFCAEPYSAPGYFHPGDRDGSVRFPDVGLHFRARDVSGPGELLHRMFETAQRVASSIGAVLRTDRGEQFDLSIAEAKLTEVLQQIRELDQR